MAAAVREKERVSAPDGWTKTFIDPRLCAAIVDRLTFGGNIIATAPTPTASRPLAPELNNSPWAERTDRRGEKGQDCAVRNTRYRLKASWLSGVKRHSNRAE
ncbi:hypothetical protein OV450_7170 [Actinobacteria bacterium OV450]|nr:hypothetical protein OV450_7170 [Actinobacteria bacterium OV450]